MATAKTSKRTPKARTIAAGRALRHHLADEALLPVYLVTTASAPPDRRRRQAPPPADPGELIAARRAIENIALKGCDRSVDHALIDYTDDNSGIGVHAVIANEARSTSLFGSRRVVSVTHADGLDFDKAPKRKPRKNAKKKRAPKGGDPLELLLTSLPTGGNPPIVIILQAERFDRRKRAFKELAARGAIVEVEPPSPRSLQAHIEEVARAHNIRVDRSVAQRLWDHLGGGDPARLRQTADRLLLDVGVGGHLTGAAVDDLVPFDRESQVWAITDAITARDITRALTVVHLLLEHGEHPLVIVGSLASHYRTLMRVDAVMQEGLHRPDDIASRLKLHPFRTRKLCEQLTRMRKGTLERAVQTVHEADLALKQTSIGDRKNAERRWIEQLLIALIRNRRLRVSRGAVAASASV